MIIALAGLQSIETQIYDASRIDGAGTLRTFCPITFPLHASRHRASSSSCRPSEHSTCSPSRTFSPTGVPGIPPSRLVLYLYRSAFKFFKLGYGAAIAFLTFILVLIPSVLQVEAVGGTRPHLHGNMRRQQRGETENRDHVPPDCGRR